MQLLLVTIQLESSTIQFLLELKSSSIAFLLVAIHLESSLMQLLLVRINIIELSNSMLTSNYVKPL